MGTIRLSSFLRMDFSLSKLTALLSAPGMAPGGAMPSECKASTSGDDPSESCWGTLTSFSVSDGGGSILAVDIVSAYREMGIGDKAIADRPNKQLEGEKKR